MALAGGVEVSGLRQDQAWPSGLRIHAGSRQRMLQGCLCAGAIRLSFRHFNASSAFLRPFLSYHSHSMTPH